ncbi:MAG: hypothetical protein ABI947_00305 [Chloroflexota bacterium]
MTDEPDDYKDFILSADKRALMRQLKSDIKTPLVSAQNLVNVLIMMQSPTAGVQKKMDSGELYAPDMLEEIGGLMNQVFDVIDFYRSVLDED